MLGRAWLFIALGILAAAVALQHALLLLIAMFFFIASGVARLWARYALERVEYSRRLSATKVFFGETITMDMRLSNAKILPMPWVRVQDDVPEDLTFLTTRTSPGHKTGRSFLSSFMSLMWYHRLTRRFPVQCLRRGYFSFGPATVRSGDLFGFFHREIEEDKRDHLLVYPKVVALEDLGIPSRDPFGDIRVRRHLHEDPVRVVSTREYVAGDPLKRIHWKASARLQRLQSRVFEPTTTVDLALFLDVRTVGVRIWGRVESLLETAVMTAASIANHALKSGYRVGLYANEPYLYAEGTIRLPPSDHPDQLQRTLEALAQVQGWPAMPLERLLNREARNLPGSATLTVITAEPTESLLATINRFRRAGRRVALILVGERDLDFSLNGLLVYQVSEDVYTRELESVTLRGSENGAPR